MTHRFPINRWLLASRWRRTLAGWTAAGALPAPARAVALQRAPAWPTAMDWRAGLDVLTLWLGALLLGAALILFIAANWDRYGVLGKLGAVEVAVLACAVLAQLTARRPRAQGAALTAGILASGALLALVGQAYHLGADTFALFGTWALVSTAWALAGRSAAAWLLWSAVVTLAVGTGVVQWNTRSESLAGFDPWLALVALHLALLAAWGPASRRLGLHEGVAHSIAPRVFALMAGGMAGLNAAMYGIMGAFLGIRYASLALPVWLLINVGLVWWALRRRDLPVLAGLAAIAVLVIATVAGRAMLHSLDDLLGGVLMTAIIVMATAAVFTHQLRALARRWRA